MTNNNDEFTFASSEEARNAAIYSPNPLKMEAANRFLVAADRYADRAEVAKEAQQNLGQYYVPLRQASTTDEIYIHLRTLHQQYKGSIKPKGVAVWFHSWRYLRLLKK